MPRTKRDTVDYVPHLPDLLVGLCGTWRLIRDAQTEVAPFGHAYVALDEARAAIEALSHKLTGQREFFRLRDVTMTTKSVVDDEPS